MVRIILGAVVGFVVWSVVWVGADAVLNALSPNWIGTYAAKVERALVNREAVDYDNTIVALTLLRSFITSVIAGYLAVLVSAEFKKTTLILGIVLLAVGLVVEIVSWNVAPAWYHVVFLLAIIPMTMLGGRLNRSASA